MITTAENVIEIAGNVAENAETAVMGIDSSALAAITDSMINLYTNKALAVIREYSTNALDAHVQAGISDPIDVTLPGEFDQRLVIVDRGIGLSKDQVLRVYSQYGASTKRGTNTQVGSFGFGCKAGFTISQSFSVAAVKDGMRTVALFSRDAQGVGTANVLSHAQTSERNGVTVTIPVADHAAFNTTARQFFANWAPGTVLVDGEQPRSIQSTGLALGPVRFLTQRQREQALGHDGAGGGIYVVMGNVSYPCHGLAASNGWTVPSYGGSIHIHAEIGDVDIVPSREGLRDSDKTKAFLARTGEAFRTQLVEHVQSLADAAATGYDAALVLRDWQPILPRQATVLRDGQELTTGIKLGVSTFTLNPGHKRDSITYGHEHIAAVGDEGTAVITGLPSVEAERIRFGLTAWMQDSEIRNVLVIEDADASHGWFDLTNPNLTVLTFDGYVEARNEVRRARARLAPHSARNEPRYTAWVDGEKTVLTVPELAGMTTIHYTAGGDDRTVPAALRAIGGLPGDHAVIALTPQQKESALLKRLPSAVPFPRIVADRTRRELRKLAGAADRDAIARHLSLASPTHYDSNALRFIRAHSARIANPAALAMLDIKPDVIAPATAAYLRLKASSLVIGTKAWREFDGVIQANPLRLGVTQQFPLLMHVGEHTAGPMREHALAYLNAFDAIAAQMAVPAAPERAAA